MASEGEGRVEGRGPRPRRDLPTAAFGRSFCESLNWDDLPSPAAAEPLPPPPPELTQPLLQPTPGERRRRPSRVLAGSFASELADSAVVPSEVLLRVPVLEVSSGKVLRRPCQGVVVRRHLRAGVSRIPVRGREKLPDEDLVATRLYCIYAI